jgi:hypothetical protein
VVATRGGAGRAVLAALGIAQAGAERRERAVDAAP